MIPIQAIVGCIFLLCALVCAADRNPKLSGPNFSQKNKNRSKLTKPGTSQKWTESDLINERMERTVSLMLGQKYAVDESISKRFRNFAINDDTNDNIALASTQEIIARSGYNYEKHYVVSSDGYVTLLIRIVNPLADRAQLKQPPVILFHGAFTDATVWVWSSAIQHHPEKYPLHKSDGHITSWNRSMAFTLANNGHDVWLAGTRGSNKYNRGHTKLYPLGKENQAENPIKWFNLTNPNVKMLEEQLKDNMDTSNTLKYWDFSMDELGSIEIPAQIDKVLEITGAKKVNMITLSMSSMTSLITFANKPSYERKVQNLVTIGPIINMKGTNTLVMAAMNTLCHTVPVELGTMVLSELLVAHPTRELLTHINKRRDLRFNFIRPLSLIMGPSPKYQAHIEQAVMGHVAMPLSFKELKHFCQQMSVGQLQKYDYGMIKNQMVYGSMTPPKYDTANIDLARWMVVSGGNDMFSTVQSVEQYVGMLKRPPEKHIHIESYSHVDIICALDIDTQVILPVLKFLDESLLDPLSEEQVQKALSKSMAPAFSSTDLPLIDDALAPEDRKQYDTSSQTQGNIVLEGHIKRSLDHLESLAQMYDSEKFNELEIDVTTN